ncbi:DEAD/DEAH box helicase [Clostridium estertheticum]|uniref:DEAD/DEAH box helicase n=1 Tax=Clostridium estertheticum TaxID=238834 RepID=UPI001CF2DAFB|nr:DEAD/DEAH box helicase [Clostridium estertheticum]MCB2356412.1 DEAD/DEAH box helicase [Clostridium estertheticum]WAG39643.1 DEAD/DEAH box helicase [Clostridium estertheticum]
MKELTLKRLRNTNFKELYIKLLTEMQCTNFEYEKILSLAIIFINSSKEEISRLGYRILVFYGNQTGDFKPLYVIALNSGLIPIVKFIEKMEKYQSKFTDSFFNVFSSSFGETYRNSNIYFSNQQQQLFSFFEEMKDETVSIVAPTSYGKSELIISSLKTRKTGNVCILVPTKSLLAQTKKRVMEAKINNILKIITHPEMFLDEDKNIVAILTQERLLRLLRKKANLSFDLVFVDEAHNLLNNDDRNILLASVLAILEKRNCDVVFKFLTPFLKDSSNLRTSYTNFTPKVFNITEYIKTERLYIYDFRNERKLKLYDQFLNDFFFIKTKIFLDDIDFINEMKSKKNIIYLNKPSDIENFSLKLTERISTNYSEKLDKACIELSKYLHEDYSLINCIKKGIIYHHGSVPDNVRIYIEHLYSTLDDVRFVVTSSTLLEGVNLPAEKLFLLDNKKGNGNLSPSQFKNLIGRVCRFSEVFSKSNGSLKKLEPSIYLVASEYYSTNANLDSFITKCMKVDKNIEDSPKNILLENVVITEKNRDEREKAEEFIENYEKGTIDNYNKRYAETEIGKACFVNNVIEIDIIENEISMQEIIDSYRNIGIKLNDSESVFQIMSETFFPFITENDKFENLKRLNSLATQHFYQMFLNWRIKNASYREMINSFLKYWEQLIIEEKETLVYVGRWGDEKRNGFRDLWTDIKRKTKSQRINLAIVRIKDEQDFLDNTLIKYIEVLNDLDFIEKDFYEKIKYGTSDEFKISLIKNGFSRGLANLIIDNYSSFIKFESKLNTVNIKSEIIDCMIDNNENEVLIIEAKYNIK